MTIKSFLFAFIKSIVISLVMLGLLLLIAGDYNYILAHYFIIPFFIGVFVQYLIFAGNKALAKERIKPGPGTKGWDKIWFKAFIVTTIAEFVISVFDSSRFFWTGEIPFSVFVIGYTMFGLGILFFFWPMYVNNWFSTLVRIQKDRAHKVVDSGPYKIVRHPSYIGLILAMLGIPLMFGSYWGLIPAVLNALFVVIRTHFEDKTLQEELAGYKEFSKKTKYRLVPFIW